MTSTFKLGIVFHSEWEGILEFFGRVQYDVAFNHINDFMSQK